MSHTPQVTASKVPELLKFCQDSAFALRLEVAGTLLIPPPRSVDVTDWERSVRLR